MRRPVLVAGAVLLALLVLGTPFARIHIGFSDDRAMPTTVESRRVGDTIRNEFPAQATAAMEMVIDGAVAADRLDGYATELSRLAHVVTVAALRRLCGRATNRRDTDAGANGVHLTVLPDADPYSAQADRLFEQIRRTPAPGTVLVGGTSAENVDTKAPWSRVFRWPPR